MGRRRVDLQEAAQLLGVSSEAVRKRAKRGTIPYETGRDGKLYVWVDGGETGDYPAGEPPIGDKGELVEALQDQIAFLRRELEAERSAHGETRQLAAMLASRVRAIEPPETPQAPATGAATTEGVDTPADTGGREEGARRPWWKRWFGGE